MNLPVIVFVASMLSLQAQQLPEAEGKPGVLGEDSLLVLNGMHKILMASVNLGGYQVEYAGVLATDADDKRFLAWNLCRDAVWIIREKDNEIREKSIDPQSEIGRLYLFKSESKESFKLEINGKETWAKIVWSPRKGTGEDFKKRVLIDILQGSEKEPGEQKQDKDLNK